MLDYSLFSFNLKNSVFTSVWNVIYKTWLEANRENICYKVLWIKQPSQGVYSGACGVWPSWLVSQKRVLLPFEGAILKSCWGTREGEDLPVWEKGRGLRKHGMGGRQKKRISGSGETESNRLARSFTNSMLDSLQVQNGCALHRAQGLCWATETRSKDSEGRREREVNTHSANEGGELWGRTVWFVEPEPVRGNSQDCSLWRIKFSVMIHKNNNNNA